MTTLFLILMVTAILFLILRPLLRICRPVAVAAAMFLLAALPAAAQDVGSTWGILMPPLLEITSIVLLAVLTWTAAWAKRKFGIDIEAKHRDALHSALMSGAQLAAARQLTGKAAVALILDYVRQSVPDALAKLSPDLKILTDLAEAKLQQTSTDRLREALAAARAMAAQ
ncbi:MAG: hypothetical protein VYB46_08680 [Pseudomonadota bacterium]|nr:hypothetical protein [Pseudomonadota bacterium]